MSKSILDITSRHGKEMYILGLKHSIETIKVLGAIEAIQHLTEKIATEEKELKDGTQ